MFLLLQIFTLSQSSTCSPYKCAPADYKMPSSYCAVSYNRTFFLSPCNSNQFCDIDSGKCKDSQVKPTLLAYPGEKCLKDLDCVFHICANKTCKGLGVDKTCISHEQCDPGLRCHEDRCQKQLDLTASGCYSEFDCINSAGCNHPVNSLIGTCTAYFSVPIGQIVSDCIAGTSYLCKSAECEPTSLLGNYGKCKVPTASLKNVPVACSDSSECFGSDGVKKVASMCICGYNPTGSSYCQVFKGDLPGLEFFSTWQRSLIASLGVCNTIRRFSEDCLRSINKYSEVLRATWNFYFYPEIQNNDRCVQEMITFEAYEVDDFSVYISIFLLILY
jgi:hypothetical protein